MNDGEERREDEVEQEEAQEGELEEEEEEVEDPSTPFACTFAPLPTRPVSEKAVMVMMEEKEEKKDDREREDNDDIVKRCILLYERGNKAEYVEFYSQMGATHWQQVQKYIQSEEKKKKDKPILHSL